MPAAMRFAYAYRRPILVLVASLWLASLMMPALAAGGRTFDGLDILLRGWEGLSRGVPSWLANPLFVAAFAAALAKRVVAAALLATSSVALGATSFMTGELLARSNAFVPEIELRAGFYVWLAALIALCLHALTSAFVALRTRTRNERRRSSAPSGTSRD